MELPSKTQTNMLCNVCGSGNIYRCELPGEVIRICAGCGNVHSQPNLEGPYAGWKRHGVKLTTSKQIEESEAQRKQAIRSLDQLSSSMASLRLRMTKDIQSRGSIENSLKSELVALRAQLGEEKHSPEMDHSHWSEALEEVTKKLEQEKFENAQLRTEAQRLAEKHEQEVQSLKEALRQVHSKNAKEKWGKLRKGAAEVVEKLNHLEEGEPQDAKREDGTAIAALHSKCRKLDISVKALKDTILTERATHEVDLNKCFGYIQELEHKVSLATHRPSEI